MTDLALTGPEGPRPDGGSAVDPGDLDEREFSVPSRLGTSLTVDAEAAAVRAGHLRVTPVVTVHGAVRASAVAFLVDAVAGLAVDVDPEAWCFTSDLSLRLRPGLAPARIDAHQRPLRTGRRSMAAEVALTDADGDEVGHALIGFTRLERRPDDPAKPEIDLVAAAELWAQVPLIDEPLRQAAGVRSIDPAGGVIEIDVRDDVRNPAGALQGAMVALAVEAAAEDLASHAAGDAQVVTELDLRFLSQGRVGPVRSHARFVGGARGSMLVELHDAGRDDALVAVSYVRASPAPRPTA